MSVDIKNLIKESIQSFKSGNLTDNCLTLFNILGYTTDRQARLDNTSFEEFRENYIDITSRFNEEKALVSEWAYVDILFQLSKAEVLKQISLFDTKEVDSTIIETYLFVAIELKGNEYSRGQLSQITREINKLFPMPVFILFKYNSLLTLSVINRRIHKRDENKDVLEKVTQIKDIRIDTPHRAHIEILFDLSFYELNRQFHFTNFVELHNAWQKTLDTKELNKRFYSELFNWYLWAVRSVNFPNDVKDNKDDTTYNSESVIRLITRLIFVWFIKEKNLVPDKLFDVQEMKNILKNFSPTSSKTSIYYRAILQNLFFATLNTQMDKDVKPEEKRRFVNPEPKYNNPDYTDQTKYRYKEYFYYPNEAIGLFSTIPFLNGGLFECLDSKEIDPKTGKEREFRFDGFSTYTEKQAFVPDILFFSPEFSIDLNNDYGTKGKKYKVEGLLNILNGYKFTITENTPLDEEIALDPELLGKVFENLLASYIPETQSTARKQTGSFYTPREIVNFMVDESLIAYLNDKLGENSINENRLRQLFAPTEKIQPFTIKETQKLVNAISTAKILDPACGSGAFPMGILHRMVDLLNKLDPDNHLWFSLQKQRAIDETAEVFNSGDTKEREIRLNEINKAFDLGMNYPDYARKLFLIENCIYGIDIQQIAIQISKLRFFISLIVDQKVDNNKPNRNILSMPNLETKFVAANTLIGLEKPKQLSLIADEVKILERDLLNIRHKIFFTRKYHSKKELKEQDRAKRLKLQDALERSGYTKNTAAQLAGWNPFDPMKSAPYFDIETMFGITDGFDLVIGNPPYDVYQGEKKNELEIIKKLPIYELAKGGKLNAYKLFLSKSLELTESGLICLIFQNSFLGDLSAINIRKHYLQECAIKFISSFPERDDVNKRVFPGVKMSTCIMLARKKAENKYMFNLDVYFDREFNKRASISYKSSEIPLIDPKYFTILSIDESEKELIKDISKHKRLDSIGNCYEGEINLTFHKKFLTTNYSKSVFPMIKGAAVQRYFIAKKMSQGEVEWVDKDAFKRENSGPKSNHYLKRRLVMQGITGVDEKQRLKMTILNPGSFCGNSVNYILFNTDVKIEYLLALLNSSILNWYFKKFSTNSNVNGYEVDNLPIVMNTIDEFKFFKVVNYLMTLKEDEQKTNSNLSTFFERLIDAMVYELYLPDSLRKANCEFLKYLNNLPILKEDKVEQTIKENLKTIDRIYKELSDPNHPVSIAMFKLDSIKEIRIIEGKQ